MFGTTCPYARVRHIMRSALRAVHMMWRDGTPPEAGAERLNAFKVR